MARHLSEEQTELLSKYQLRGSALVEALSHLEVCEECRRRIKSPTKAEIFARLLPDDEDLTNESDEPEDSSETAEKPKKNWLTKIKEYLKGNNNLFVTCCP